MNDFTDAFERAQHGQRGAAEEILPLVYGELRRLAASKLGREAPGQTLQPTALVHEAWLRLGGKSQPHWENEKHFIGAAAEAMRRILVENARRKLRLKRGGRQERVELLESSLAAPAEDEKVLQVHEALEALEGEEPEKAQIVKLRFFVGMKNEEIARLLGVSEKTVRRHWELAKLRLFEAIKAGQ